MGGKLKNNEQKKKSNDRVDRHRWQLKEARGSANKTSRAHEMHAHAHTRESTHNSDKQKLRDAQRIVRQRALTGKDQKPLKMA